MSFAVQEKQYVGFATLPNQVHRKSVKKGFDFTLMVAGQSVDERLRNIKRSLKFEYSPFLLH